MPTFSLALSALVTALAVHAAPSLKRHQDECANLYISVKGDTCDSIGAKYTLSGGAIYNANTYLDCYDIWPGTHVCIPAEEACKETYFSAKDDTCQSIDEKYQLVPGTIKSANSFLDCTDVWEGTPICVPNGPYQLDSTCKETYYSVDGDTCATIEEKYNLHAGAIKGANDFVTCDDIWTGTPICVPPGPYKACKSVHVSVAEDTCESLDTAYNLVPGTVLGANPHLTCSDIWVWTKICIPDGPYNSASLETDTETETSPQPSCTTYSAALGDTCGRIAARFNLNSADILAANPTINCGDIDTGASVLICTPSETSY